MKPILVLGTEWIPAHSRLEPLPPIPALDLLSRLRVPLHGTLSSESHQEGPSPIADPLPLTLRIPAANLTLGKLPLGITTMPSPLYCPPPSQYVDMIPR